MPFLIIYSSPDKTRYRLYDYFIYDHNHINSYGWRIIGYYRWYNNRFVKKSDYYNLVTLENNKRLLKQHRLEKIINLIELIKDVLWFYY